MAAGVDAPGNLAMEIPINRNLNKEVPLRIRERLGKTATSSSLTGEEIEEKLKHAEFRRKQFYDTLSNKARPKPRSPSYSLSHDEDLGQRLEAKLQAAEQKRLNILAMAQMRLAKMDEMRQAAKTGVELRFEKKREERGTKVESRVQQAEANRLLILKARKQRRATLRERTSQSLLRRMARESKYKECVRAAIHQKRIAAENKRLGLLEAEKKRAHARVLKVRGVAKSISHQREIERRKLKDKLEARLQRARRQRAEYLRQRGRLQTTVLFNWIKSYKQADLLSRKLARCWKRFLRLRRTTFTLAKAYEVLQINKESVKSMPFEQLARLIGSASTLQTVKAVLDRLESRLKICQDVAVTNSPLRCDNIDHLLKRVASPIRKGTAPKSSTRTRQARKVGASKQPARSPAQLSRYQVRVVLCAYMILGHPDAVFSGQGEREVALATSAEGFVREFEVLLRIILDGPIHNFDEESETMSASRCTFRSQLAAFDKAWCTYLNCFVVWKVRDAQSLVEDLVRAACQMELSMIQTCKMTPHGESIALTHDMKAIQKQVSEDQKLLKEKVHHLSGEAGIERMDSALADTRTKYFQGRENGSPSGSPDSHFLLSSPSSPSVIPTHSPNSDGMKPSHVARALFREDPSTSGVINSNHQNSSSRKQPVTENEMIVNELLHEQGHAFASSFNLTSEEQNSLQARIRGTMETAFWDSILESVKQDEANYNCIIDLAREVRDELCNMAPKAWKEEIFESIDLDILSQVLKSGNPDMEYLSKILEFSLAILQKLSPPADDEKMESTYKNLMEELRCICQSRDETNQSFVIALVKGLRFVLERIQVLKKEILKARINMVEPLLKGSAGLDYLRNAFASRYGPPSDGLTSLPRTVRWFSYILGIKDQAWEEHRNSLSYITSHEQASNVFLPSTTLRTGGNVLGKAVGNEAASFSSFPTSPGHAGSQQPECTGERIDLVVRLGLLELVSAITGVNLDSIPETSELNLARLRSIQAQVQKIIVISTSTLILRQILASDQAVSSLTDLESILSKCSGQLSEFLDSSVDAGIKEIVELISNILKDGGRTAYTGKIQSMSIIMARMLSKSLQAGDPVFERVSRAIYLAMRGVVLGGTGTQGRKLAEAALRQVGAVALIKRVVEKAEVLVVAANVSVKVHGPWYAHLVDNI